MYKSSKHIYKVNKIFTDNETDLKSKLAEVTLNEEGLASKLLQDLKNNVNVDKKNYSQTFRLGIGGIHSKNKELILEANNDYAIIDADITSFYPSLIEIFNIFKQDNGESYIQNLYNSLIANRKKAKKEGNKILSDGLKLVLNSVYGKLKQKTSALYFPERQELVSRLGQIYILYLIDLLTNNLSNCKVFFASTDGIIIYINKNEIEDFTKLTDRFFNETKLQLGLTGR